MMARCIVCLYRLWKYFTMKLIELLTTMCVNLWGKTHQKMFMTAGRSPFTIVDKHTEIVLLLLDEYIYSWALVTIKMWVECIAHIYMCCIKVTSVDTTIYTAVVALQTHTTLYQGSYSKMILDCTTCIYTPQKKLRNFQFVSF